MELFVQIVIVWKPLFILTKSSILDLWIGSEYFRSRNFRGQKTLRFLQSLLFSRKFMTLKVGKPRVRKSLCSKSILISFAHKHLCHFIIFCMLGNWNIWSKTIIYFERVLFQGSSFQPHEILCPCNIWFRPIYESLYQTFGDFFSGESFYS